ncbi:recombinase family protein [Streptomyces sp. NPDC054901]
MRVLGLTIDDHSWLRTLIQGLPPEHDQRAMIRRWAVSNGHDLLSVHEYTDSTFRVTQTYLAGTIQAVLIATGRVLETPLYSWPNWITRGIVEYKNARLVDRGIPHLIATDTGNPLDVAQRLRVARQAARPRTPNKPLPPLHSEHMQSRRRDKKAKGGYAYGAPPFGWIAYRGWLLPDVGEQGTRDRALQLRDEGKTLRRICEQLDAEGHETRSRAKWTSGALSRILDRPPPPPESLHPPTEPYDVLYDKALTALHRRRRCRP